MIVPKPVSNRFCVAQKSRPLRDVKTQQQKHRNCSQHKKRFKDCSQAMSLRQRALDRLGHLGSIRISSTSTTFEKLNSYHARQIAKNANGRLSSRRVEAFLGLCRTNTLSSQVLIDEMHTICARWPQNSPDIFGNNRLKHVSRAMFDALLCTEDMRAAHLFLTGLIDKVGHSKNECFAFRKLTRRSSAE